MLVSEFDFDLPEELIAQVPCETRDAARLLVLDRQTGSLSHRHVVDLPDLLAPGDVLVVNDTRVIAARLLGVREPTGGAVECLLLTRIDEDHWEALMHPGQKLRVGGVAWFEGDGGRLYVEVLERRFYGRRRIRLWTVDGASVDEVIERLGHVPLPPYIRRSDVLDDRERYQTVYASVPGSVAAPTAGLHLTEPLLDRLRDRGIETVKITLHVGYGTFQPIRVEKVADHRIESEPYDIPEETVVVVQRALTAGRRVVAVGTTTTRTLETASRRGSGRVHPGAGVSDLYLYPGSRFHVVGGLFTNFHLPQSSLLMLVSAFAGRERTLAAYAEAVRQRYRFYSYGDAMVVL